MATPKFKVGERVRIRASNGDNEGDFKFSFTDDMVKEFGGKFVTIKKVTASYSDAKYAIPDDCARYIIEEDSGRYTWASSMFEKTKDKTMKNILFRTFEDFEAFYHEMESHGCKDTWSLSRWKELFEEKAQNDALPIVVQEIKSWDTPKQYWIYESLKHFEGEYEEYRPSGTMVTIKDLPW